jgi:putative flippase GtrA
MKRLFLQAVRFFGIGFLNTAVDFAVINFLATLFGIYEGLGLAILNIISFSTAVIHSYYWNKNWAFVSSSSEKLFENIAKFIVAAGMGGVVILAAFYGPNQEYGAAFYISLILILAVGELILWKWLNLSGFGTSPKSRELLLFFVVSVIGALINTGIITLATSYIDPLFGMGEQLWLNFAKAAATGISLVWNFVGYKIFVFKR